ncbi:beta strand repeat-containing protein [Qipengyuania sp. MTN3-11]|uniref:beta strand repeat-containing protein n=1 Tax=Qipengyuania sp. MTN3-11 TaxID=3056557 RepID=UPI0036F25334
MADIRGSDNADTLVGSADADTITGNGGNDLLYGLAGDDTIFGNAGNDTLVGGAGTDALAGGAGDDVYYVVAGDGITEAVGGGFDLVFASGSFTLNANAEVESLGYAAAPTGTAGGASVNGAFNTTADVDINLTGNEFAQQIVGTAGDNVLIGGRNTDATTGDVLFGFDGDDTFLISNPNDVVAGEAGSTGNDIVFVSASSLNAQGLAVASYTLGTLGIENLSAQNQAGSESLSLTGAADNQIISGNQGSNTLAGGGGLDTLNGFGGNDTYVIGRVPGAAAGDPDTTLTVIGQETGGTDTVNFVAGAAGYNFTTFNGGSMADLEIEVINANANQHVVGNNFGQTINGAGGSETLEGGAGMDTLVGGAGDDVLLVDMDGETVTDASGSNTVVFTGTTGGFNLANTTSASVLAAGVSITPAPYFNVASNLDLNGTAANTPGVYLVGNTASQTIYGAGGNDILDGDRGTTANADVLRGGAGDDIYRVYAQSDVVGEGTFLRDAGANTITYNAATNAGGNDTIFTSASYSLAANAVAAGGDFIENLTVASAASTTDYTLTGSAIANQIVGAAGDDTLAGGGDNGTDFDTLIGLAGDDTYIIATGNEIIRESENGGDDTAELGAGVTTYTLTDGAYVETIDGSGAGAAVTITGNALAQEIIGTAAGDTISGGGGADTLSGGDGADTYLVATDGAIINDNQGANTVTYNGDAGGGITVSNGASVTAINTTEDGGVYLTGNNGVQTITGGAGADTLNGAGGVDVNGDGDTLQGGAGDDIYRVFSSNFAGTTTAAAVGDVINEAAGAGNDTVYTSASYVLGANVENLVSANQSVATNITLVGNGGNNAISGDQGNNVLVGGAGNDRLTGLGGADTFHFANTGTTNADVIVDFASGSDRISLDSGTFDFGASFEASEFVNGREATAAGPQILYDQATGQMFYDADGTGVGAAQLFAQLQPGTAVTAADFVLTPAGTIPTP